MNWKVLGLALTFALAGCMSSGVRLQRSVEKKLSASFRSDSFELHYAPGILDAGEVARLTRLLESELTRISTLLAVERGGLYRIYVFRDVEEMRAQTGAEARGLRQNTAAFAGFGACYATPNNDPALIHELVHLIADAKIGREGSSFAAEGLADALLEFPHRIDVDAVVKYHRQAGILPPLARWTSARNFVDVQVPDHRIDHYSIAASWIRFLFETYGAEKLKRYYRETQTENVFGVGLGALETAWLARANKYELKAAETAVLASKAGNGTRNTWILPAEESFVLKFPKPPDRPNSTLTNFVWTKNGEPLPDAKGLQLRFPSLRPSDAGTYALSIVEPGKATETMEVQLKVLPWTELPPTRGLRPLPR